MRLPALIAPMLAALLAAQEQAPKPTPPAPAASTLLPTLTNDFKNAPPGTDRWLARFEDAVEVAPGQSEIVRAFPFHNPNATEVQWRQVVGSCTCSRATVRVGERRYEVQQKPAALFALTGTGPGARREPVDAIPVPAGADGELELRMETGGLTTLKAVYVDVHTTDPQAPTLRMRVFAAPTRSLALSPATVELGTMVHGERKPFTVEVTSPTGRKFAITGHDALPPDFTAEAKAAADGDGTHWTITGSYGPVATGEGHGGTLRFRTDLEATPTFAVEVHADVRPPVSLTPGFLTFGVVKKGAGASQQVVLEANDGRDLEAGAVRLDKLTLPEKFVTARTRKDGKKVVLEVAIAADAPAGLLRGDVVVALQHPQMPEVRVLFNGFVR